MENLLTMKNIYSLVNSEKSHIDKVILHNLLRRMLMIYNQNGIKQQILKNSKPQVSSSKSQGGNERESHE